MPDDMDNREYNLNTPEDAEDAAVEKNEHSEARAPTFYMFN